MTRRTMPFMARCELLTTWGISTTGNFCMWHCDITTFYVSCFDYDIFFIVTSVKRKERSIFLGWYLGFNYSFFFLISFYMYDNISLGDLRTWTNTIHGVLQAVPLVLSFFWCFLMFICFGMFMPLCLVSSSSSFLFWSCAWKDCTNGLCFCFAFMCFLFLARRHALIRDAPDDLYFSPPCFFLFAT